jgi:hypothetical protein
LFGELGTGNADNNLNMSILGGNGGYRGLAREDTRDGMRVNEHTEGERAIEIARMNDSFECINWHEQSGIDMGKEWKCQ